MSDKKNIILVCVILVLFFLLFPLKLEPNLKYFSDNAISLSNSVNHISDNKIPYIYKNRAGYFSTDLKASWGMDILDGVSLLEDGYINSLGNNFIEFHELDGSLRYSIPDSGYTFNIDKRLFVIGRDRKSLSEIVGSEKIWTRKFNYIITTIDASPDSIVIGFVRGFFTVLDNQGATFFNYEPGGSRVPIIYNTVISNDDIFIGIISGLDPQRFILYGKKETEYKPIYSFNLKDEFRKTSKIFITSDNKSIFFEGVGGFYLFDIESKTIKFIEGNFNLINVQYMPDVDLYMVHSGAVNFNNVRLLSADSRVLFEKSFVGDSVSVKTLGESLYIVIDNSVVKIDIKE